MGKRANGTASIPITFSSQYGIELRDMRKSGVNISDWIDKAIRLVIEHGNRWGESHGIGSDDYAIRECAEMRIEETLQGESFLLYACRRAWVHGHTEGYVVLHPRLGMHKNAGGEE